jgi:hypothetical protein
MRDVLRGRIFFLVQQIYGVEIVLNLPPVIDGLSVDPDYVSAQGRYLGFREKSGFAIGIGAGAVDPPRIRPNFGVQRAALVGNGYVPESFAVFIGFFLNAAHYIYALVRFARGQSAGVGRFQQFVLDLVCHLFIQFLPQGITDGTPERQSVSAGRRRLRYGDYRTDIMYFSTTEVSKHE